MKRRITGKQDDAEAVVGDALLQLNDDFTEYHALSAFLCTAFTEVMSSHRPLQEEVIQGAKQCSELLRARTNQMKQELALVRALYIEELDATGGG